jgi:hypothetical protein
MLTRDYVAGLMDYQRDTGTFIWRVTQGSVKAGRRAGSRHSSGYVHVRINKRGYKAHQLVWLMETGTWPAFPLDHIDGDGGNNHHSNLRDCTMSQNKANSRSYKNNKSGIKGVCYNKKLNRWGASIQCGGKRHHLGLFHTKEEAAEVYMASAALFFGPFARAA